QRRIGSEMGAIDRRHAMLARPLAGIAGRPVGFRQITLNAMLARAQIGEEAQIRPKLMAGGQRPAPLCTPRKERQRIGQRDEGGRGNRADRDRLVPGAASAAAAAPSSLAHLLTSRTTRAT